MRSGKKIVKTLPFYPDHKIDHNDVVYVDTLHNSLNAENLKKSLKGINSEEVGAFIFCSSNNPMGWYVYEKTGKKLQKS